MRRRAFISLFGVLAAASSLAAHAQESATMRPTGTLPQIEVARVKPVDRSPPNLRLSDDLIDLLLEPSPAAPSNETRITQAPVAERPVALPPPRRWRCKCGSRSSP